MLFFTRIFFVENIDFSDKYLVNAWIAMKSPVILFHFSRFQASTQKTFYLNKVFSKNLCFIDIFMFSNIYFSIFNSFCFSKNPQKKISV